MSSDVARQWSAIAEQYSRWVGAGGEDLHNPFTKLVTDAVLDLVGDVRGEKVLDMGCGHGYLARILDSRGASVTGVDLAVGMINLAVNADPSKISYLLGDLCTDLPFQTESFGRVVCNMVLMDLEDMESVIREAYRVLRQRGLLVISIVHPCFYRATGEWDDTEQDTPVFRPRRRYIEPCATMKTLLGMDPATQVPHYHRPIQDYVRALLRSGFILSDLCETSLDMTSDPQYLRHHMTANNLILSAYRPANEKT